MLQKLNAFELWAYRRMLRISCKDKISNEIVLRRIQSQRILTKTIKERKLQYFGHLVRRGDLQRVLMEAKVAGKRGRGPRATYASYVDPIFRLQKKAVRAISFQPRLSPSLPIFKDLKLLKLSEIFELRLLIFVFDSVNKTSPSCFHNFFLFSSSVHQYYTRQASQGDLYISRINSLQYGLKSIRYLGAKLWNSLPVELRNAPSKISFKKQLKAFLLNKVNH